MTGHHGPKVFKAHCLSHFLSHKTVLASLLLMFLRNSIESDIFHVAGILQIGIRACILTNLMNVLFETAVLRLTLCEVVVDAFTFQYSPLPHI